MSDWRQRAEQLDWAAHRRHLQPKRFRPMFDRAFGQLLKNGMGEAFAFRDGLKAEFLHEFDRWLHGSKLNHISGLSAFPHRDFIQGVTHSLDDLHITFGHRLVCLEKEYAYHWRMKADFPQVKPEQLKAGDVLVLGAPFPWHGELHPQTQEVLDRCVQLGIPVHIDSAWVGCLRNFSFHYDHPAIQSASFSLSKGLGLGSHRVGVRYSRERHPGPVTIVNDFSMEVNSVMYCGIRFMREFGSDYLQNRYGEAYDVVCEKLDLRPTLALHVAFGEVEPGQWWPLGIRPFLRYLVDELNEFK